MRLPPQNPSFVLSLSKDMNASRCHTVAYSWFDKLTMNGKKVSIDSTTKRSELQSMVIPANGDKGHAGPKIQSVQSQSLFAPKGRSMFGLGPSLRWDDEPKKTTLFNGRINIERKNVDRAMASIYSHFRPASLTSIGVLY